MKRIFRDYKAGSHLHFFKAGEDHHASICVYKKNAFIGVDMPLPILRAFRDAIDAEIMRQEASHA